MIKMVADDIELCEFDGVTAVAVYSGGVNRLEKINHKLRWRYDAEISRMCFDPAKVLKLSEIAEQCKDEYIITVIVESPLHGEIYQYGNYYDNKWYKIGETAGYA